MSDLISRQAAINAVTSWLNKALHPINQSKYNEGEIDAYETALSEIKKIPSAQPERTGRWILEWETDDTRMLRCSECRMVFNVGTGRDGNYCPNCGAKMDE